jgi:hypothetical protein
MTFAAIAAYLHNSTRPWALVVPLLMFGPPLVSALIIWRQTAHRLAALLILAALSYCTVSLVAAIIFNEGPMGAR